MESYASDNDSVNRNVNGARKDRENLRLQWSKHEVIEKLQLCTFKTPPREVAALLESLFRDYESKNGHWLYVAQHWNPRAINRVIAEMVRQHQRGDQTIHIPPAYFTKLIRYRKKRRNLMRPIGTSKK